MVKTHTLRKDIFRKEELAEGVELFMGNCLDVIPTLGKVQAIITDPPYEEIMQKNWQLLTDRGRHTNHEKLDFDSIDKIRDDVIQKIASVLSGWAILFCMAEGVRAWRDSIENSGGKYKRAMVWMKTNALPQLNGQGPSMGHEMMVSAWYGNGYSKWNGGGQPGNFVYPITSGKDKHPTQKPLPLMIELVKLFSNPDDIVCDPFMGSGTTGIACINLGRRFVGIELNEKFFDVACKRISKFLKSPDFLIQKPKMKQTALTPKYR